ncbi:hypothetical protein [uncultured Flavobacterium sp.]|jgi:hypothetical protein|uniref:hypothetical protein n=1 Tax=uncultured Flavobacterium sp. TaxID=165435 RepID=UPI0025967DF3|nr:hypothetical protein [uncultured Flavobacterium sp.]
MFKIQLIATSNNQILKTVKATSLFEANEIRYQFLNFNSVRTGANFVKVIKPQGE